MAPDMRRVLISGRGRHAIVTAARDLDADAWLEKPFDLTVLSRALGDAPSVQDVELASSWREDNLVFVLGPPRRWALGAFPALDSVLDMGGPPVRIVQVDDTARGAGGGFLRWLLNDPRSPDVVEAIAFVSTDETRSRDWLAAANTPQRPPVRCFRELTSAVHWAAKAPMKLVAARSTRPDLPTVPEPPTVLEATDPPRVDTKPNVAAPVEGRARPRVLVVDDEPTIRRLLSLFLKPLGVDVVEAETIAQAEELLEGRTIHAAVCDKNLPDGSGLDLARVLCSELDGAAVVIMTAHPTEESRNDALRLGAAAYLEKPFALQDLERALSTALRGATEALSHAGVQRRRLDVLTHMLQDLNDRLTARR